MNLPVVLAGVTAGMLAAAVASTYLDPKTPFEGGMSQAEHATLFSSVSTAEREFRPDTYAVALRMKGNRAAITILLHSRPGIRAM